VRVPDEAGDGKAKVTFSFDAWKEGKVRPSTVELPIAEPKNEEKDQKP
jgi:hypothetical protein